jgi:methyl-accepting chemotaxis protein
MVVRVSAPAGNPLSLRQIGALTRSMSVSVRVKLQFAFAAVALMTVVAVAIGIYSFSATEREFQRVAGRDVPMMTNALRLSAMSGEISAAAARFVSSKTADEQRTIADLLASRHRELSGILQQLRADGAGTRSFAQVESASQRLDQNLKVLEKAILDRGKLRSQLEERQSAVHKVHSKVSEKLTPIVDDSYFEVVSAADDAGKVGNKSIRSFINGGLQRLQAILELGAETSMSTGLLAAGATTLPAPMLTQLEERYAATAQRARRLLSKLPEDAEFAPLRTQVSALLQAADFKSPAKDEGEGADRLKKIFRAHESLTGVLVKLVDDLNFTLMMNGEDAAKKSTGLLKTLVNKQISDLRNALETAAQTHLLTTLISEGASAKEIERLVPIQDRFRSSANLLRKVSGSLSNAEVKKSIDELIVFGTAADGVFALRGQELQADLVASRAVTENVAIQRDLDKTVAILVGEAEAGMKRSESELIGSLGHYRMVLIAVAIISILAAAGIGMFYVQRNLVKPLSAIDQNMDRLAIQIADTVSEIKLSASEVANGATEISTSTTDLSQRTEEQAASLEETSKSLEQMAATITKNADNARQASTLASDTQEVANRGGSVVAQTVEAMARIEASSRRMEDIINVIDEVARQTNLLALNAAVEAARAGEAGRGFAVVASEVRSLAQRSSQSAKDIRELISNSATQVKEGVDLVNFAGKTLDEVVASIRKVTEVIGSIASDSAEQSSGIEQINVALSQMDEVTQQNSALVEENAATAKTLEMQAAQMDARVAALQTETTGSQQADLAAPGAKQANQAVPSRSAPKRTGTYG